MNLVKKFNRASGFATIIILVVILVGLIGVSAYLVKTERIKLPVSISSFFLKFLDQKSNVEGQFCGGIAGVSCPQGYRCKLDGNYPDAGGTCVKN